MGYSLPGSSVYGISQARILEWVAIPFSRDCPNPGIEPGSPVLSGGFFTTKPPVLVTQSCSSFATLWTVARQAPLSMGFSRQEY